MYQIYFTILNAIVFYEYSNGFLLNRIFEILSLKDHCLDLVLCTLFEKQQNQYLSFSNDRSLDLMSSFSANMSRTKSLVSFSSGMGRDTKLSRRDKTRQDRDKVLKFFRDKTRRDIETRQLDSRQIKTAKGMSRQDKTFNSFVIQIRDKTRLLKCTKFRDETGQDSISRLVLSRNDSRI